jgi:hypothetical protein
MSKQTTLDKDVVKVGPNFNIPKGSKLAKWEIRQMKRRIENRGALYGDHGEEVGSIQLSPGTTLSDFIHQFTQITANPFTEMILQYKDKTWHGKFSFHIYRALPFGKSDYASSYRIGLQIFASSLPHWAINFQARYPNADIYRQVRREMGTQDIKLRDFHPSEKMALTASNLNSLREKFPTFFRHASDMKAGLSFTLRFYYSPPEDLPFDETYPTIPGYITNRRMRGLVPDLKEGQQFHEEREDVREFIREREVPRIEREFPKMRFQPSIEESIEMADRIPTEERKRTGDDIDTRDPKRYREAAARLLQQHHDIETAAQMLAQFQF